MDTTYSQSRPRLMPQAALRDAAPPGGLTDAEIIAGSLRNPNRFEALFERHWTDLRRFCASRAGAAGEDIAADVFRTAFDRRHRYDPRFPDAKPWLFGIATNQLRDHFRAAAREEDKRSRSAALAARPDAGEAMSGLERQLLGPRLASALSEIPAVERDALLLLAWADLDYLEIAHALGVPIGTVRSRIHRARQRLQTHLNTFEYGD
jgi:RNA polymerase sigma-70 factor, ECF subfamily